MRWPSGANPTGQPIGYHDDSFAYETIDPPSYNFLGLLKAAGETNKWRAQPIGGEVYPPIQSCMWDTNQPGCMPAGQGFSNCVNLTHASWMLNQGVFDPGFTGSQQTLALAGARQLGYELFVTNAAIADASISGSLNVSVQIRNTGVAPFYYDWPIQIGIFNNSNSLTQTWATPWKLSSLLPGANTAWIYTQNNHGLAAGQYKCLLRVQNPLTNGVPFSFANKTQNADLPGWLTLGQFLVVNDASQPTLSGAPRLSGFELNISDANPGAWIVQDSSDLIVWKPMLSTNTSTTEWSVIDDISSLARFYRVVSQQ